LRSVIHQISLINERTSRVVRVVRAVKVVIKADLNNVLNPLKEIHSVVE
jgi:hypothetical protein